MPKEMPPKKGNGPEKNLKGKITPPTSRFRVETQEDMEGRKKEDAPETIKPASKFRVETEESLKERQVQPRGQESGKGDLKKDAPVSKFRVETQEQAEARVAGKSTPDKTEKAKQPVKTSKPEVGAKINLKKDKKKTEQVTKAPKFKKPEKPAPPKASAEKEKLEAALEKARTEYVRAKLQSEKDPQNSKSAAELETSQKAYFKERQKSLQEKLEFFNKEELRGKNEKVKEKELRKAAAMLIFSEVKKSYDYKTKILAEEKAKNKPWLMQKVQAVGEWYGKKSFKEKMLISGALMGTAMVSAGVGGGVGAALGILIGAGKLSQRVLSGSAQFVGLEGFLKMKDEKAIKNLDIKYGNDYRNLLKESLDKTKFNTPKRLVKFLQANDLVLEQKVVSSTQELEKKIKQLENRRYFIAGSVGLLTASGVTAAAFEKLGEVTGLSNSVQHLLEKAGLGGPEIAQGASSEAIVRVTEKHADLTATIQEGGSVSKAAWQLVGEGKLSKEDMLRAWNNSFVEIQGVQVPIKDVALSHAGDQITYVPGISGSPGHLKIIDFAKDKLSLGTNQNLAEIYEEMKKEQPNWLKHATGQNVFESLKTNHLDANGARNIQWWFDRGPLHDQDVILNQLNDKIGHLDKIAGHDFTALRDHLADSPHYTKSLEAYENLFKPTGLTGKEWDAIREMKVGEFLAKRGRSWWSDYFWPKGVPTSVAPSAHEILHQRKLAELIRKSLLSSWEKDLSLEQFTKMLVKG